MYNSNFSILRLKCIVGHTPGFCIFLVSDMDVEFACTVGNFAFPWKLAKMHMSFELIRKNVKV